MEPPLATQEKADFDTRLQCQGNAFQQGDQKVEEAPEDAGLLVD